MAYIYMEPFPAHNMGGSHMTLVWLGNEQFDPELGQELADNLNKIVKIPGQVHFSCQVSGHRWFGMPTKEDPDRRVRVALMDIPHMLHIARYNVLGPFNESTIPITHWRPHISIHQGIRCPQLGEQIILGRAQFKQSRPK